MQIEHVKLIEALNRVDDFLTRHHDLLDDAGITPAARANFAASRQRLLDQATAQDAHARGVVGRVATKRRLREALIRGHMRPISTIARNALANQPNIAELLMPSRRQTYTDLVATARGMARAAEVNRSTFLDAGLPPDFLARFVAAIDALEAEITVKDAARSQRMGATRGLRDAARGARGVVRILDTLMCAALEGHRAVLAEWTAASRIESVPAPAALPARAGAEARALPPAVHSADTSLPRLPAADRPPLQLTASATDTVQPQQSRRHPFSSFLRRFSRDSTAPELDAPHEEGKER